MRRKDIGSGNDAGITGDPGFTASRSLASGPGGLGRVSSPGEDGSGPSARSKGPTPAEPSPAVPTDDLNAWCLSKSGILIPNPTISKPLLMRLRRLK